MPEHPRSDGSAQRSTRAAARSGRSAASEPSNWREGLLFGILGLLAFSGTLPATRLATPILGPIVLTCGRLEMAAILSVICLLLLPGRRRPRQDEWWGIIWMGLGLGVGYPLFVALALRDVPSAHGAVVVGLAPASTAIIAFLRAGDRPSGLFWVGSLIGVAAVAVFAIRAGGGSLSLADGWLVAAIVSVGLAYVEGGRVAREFGGTATLCWSMIVLAPFAVVPFAIAGRNLAWGTVSGQAWLAFAYTGIVSMFLGSIAWYRGLATGGISRIGQLNLAQPLLALLWSALLLGERIPASFIGTAIVVLVAMLVCLKSRVPVERPPGTLRSSSNASRQP